MYAASKAALVVGSEVWRLELAPLGVRTITIMAGGIDTNFLANLPNLPLLDTSQYHSIKDIVQTQRETVPYGVAPDVFAAQVLQKVEQGATGKVWLGGATLPARIALWLLPSSFIVSVHFQKAQCLLMLCLRTGSWRTTSRFLGN